MSSDDDLLDIKVSLNLKGQLLMTAWSELTSLLNTYEAKLNAKEAEAKFQLKTQGSSPEVTQLKAELTHVKSLLKKTQMQLTEKDMLIIKLQTDLASVESKLLVAHQHIGGSTSRGSRTKFALATKARPLEVKVEEHFERLFEMESGVDMAHETAVSYSSLHLQDNANEMPAETSSVICESTNFADTTNIMTSSPSSFQSQKRKQIEQELAVQKIIKTEPEDVSIIEEQELSSSASLEEEEGLAEEAPQTDPILMVLRTNALESVPTNQSNQKQGTNLVIHSQEPIPATGKRSRPRRRCHLCYSLGKRKDTRYYCPACPRQPAFCVEPCFEIYHSKLHKVQIPLGENPALAIKRDLLSNPEIMPNFSNDSNT